MASWKQVTEADGSTVLVNMDNVTFMKASKGRSTNYTLLCEWSRKRDVRDRYRNP